MSQTNLPSVPHIAGVLRAIAEALNGAAPIDEMLTAALAALVEGMDYRAAAIRLLKPETDELQLRAAFNLSQEYLQKGPVRLAHSPIDRRVMDGETVAVTDLTEDTFQYPGAAEREGLRSILAVPVRLRGRPVGVLRAYHSEPHDFSPDERTVLEALASLLGRTIANARLYQAFRQLAHEISGSLDVDEVLRRLLAGIVAALDCKGAALRLLGEKGRRLHLVAATGLSETYLKKGDVVIEQSPVDQRVLGTKLPAMIADIENEGGLQYPEEAAAEGIRSVLVVPLILRGEAMGVLRVYSSRAYRFTAEAVALASASADMGAVALENARLHETLEEKYERSRSDWSGWFRYLAMD